jgi:hypothetical protein
VATERTAFRALTIRTSTELHALLTAATPARSPLQPSGSSDKRFQELRALPVEDKGVCVLVMPPALFEEEEVWARNWSRMSTASPALESDAPPRPLLPSSLASLCCLARSERAERRLAALPASEGHKPRRRH